MFKIGEMKSEKIVKGILITVVVYCLIIILPMIANTFLMAGTNGSSAIVKISGYFYLISMIATPIMILVLIKLLCEGLYKIIKAAEIIIENNKKDNN